MNYLFETTINFNNQELLAKLYKVTDISLLPEKLYRVYALAQNGEGDYTVVYNSKKDRWGLPGGHTEKGENYEETVSREYQEEVGFKLESIEPAFILSHEIKDSEPEFELIVLAKSSNELSKIDHEGESITKVVELSLDELPTKLKPALLWQKIVDSIKI